MVVSTAKEIDAILHSFTSNSNGIPGVVCRALNKDGTVLYEGVSGAKGLNHQSEPISIDTMFYVASCTKVKTRKQEKDREMKEIERRAVVNCFVVDYWDSSNAVSWERESYTRWTLRKTRPWDWKDQNIGWLWFRFPPSFLSSFYPSYLLSALDDKPIFKDPTTKITLRQLLTHTSGFTYEFGNPATFKFHTQNKVLHLLLPSSPSLSHTFFLYKDAFLPTRCPFSSTRKWTRY